MKEAWSIRNGSLLSARLGKTDAIQADFWFHCASVGEVNAVAPLVFALQAQGKPLLVTSFTPTGLEQAQRRFSGLVDVKLHLLPIDWKWTIQRFLAQIVCPQLVIVETELWPNLIHLAHQKNMRIRLINARITHKTLSAPRWWRRLLVRLLDEKVDQVLCRSPQDLKDFRQLGVTKNHLHLVGNLKWCDLINTPLPCLYSQPYVVFASTHQSEEIELARLWQSINNLPTLVIVPRHPNRAADIVKQFTQIGIAFSQRSQSAEHTHGILLADTFGELTAWMAHAELVIMGGSFVPKGGQNPLEATRLGKLVLCGPDMRDFVVEVSQLCSLNALIQVNNFSELMTAIALLLRQPEQIALQANAGQTWLLANQGQVLTNYLQALEPLNAVS
jgi:3-deoxy-D-manno-octulosonic-acid transferase